MKHPKSAAKAAETPEETSVNAGSLATQALGPEASPQAVKEKIPASVTAPNEGGSQTAVKPYVIQIATYINREDAQKMSDQLVQEGFPSFIENLSRQNGKVYFCVFIGRFGAYSEAESMLSEFKKKAIAQPFQDAFIRALGSH